ncbi:MAG: hypothetical protein L3J07_03750 [Candidatus Magasanikbacteria bacterium]|nr:hypothetical protein [Candidatus Magasanikbacteria bacterium]
MPSANKSTDKKVDSMPGIIVGRITKETVSKENSKKILKKKKIILWVSVISISCVILIMWILNMSILFFDIDFQEKTEEGMFKTAKFEFNTTMDEFLLKDENGKNKNIITEIEKTLEQIVSSTTQTATSSEENIE